MGLQEDFGLALNKAIEEVEKSRGLTIVQLRAMIGETGALTAVKSLIDTNFSSKGLLDLISLECSEVSIESLVLDARFESLFSKEQLQTAKSRLPV
jgi:hypothetical protein